jgi:hypothetical protein
MIILGQAGLVETGRRGGITSRGVWTEVRYEGPVDAVNAAIPNYASAGLDIEYDCTNPPKGSLVVRTPDYGDGEGTGIVQTQFDLVANLSQRSGYEHSRSIALGSQLDTIKEGLKANSKPTLTGNASTLYDMMRAGQDSYVSSQFVFRVTQYFVNGTILDIAYSDVNRVHSNVALLAETNPTALYQAAIQNAYTEFLQSTYSNSVPSGHTYGWLKQSPQLQNVSGNRSALTVEYWLEAWRDYYYS